MDLCNSFRKWITLTVVGVALILGLTGCALDDALAPFGIGDVPFEQGQTAPTDMGAVDNPMTVPDEPFEDYELGLT